MTARIGRSCVLALLLMAPGATALAQSTTTTQFLAAGAEQTFTVPAGVTWVDVVATGGHGGSANSGIPGTGATFTGALPVRPGQVLYVQVGGAGSSGTTSGVFNGGGSTNGAFSGQGGGASDIRTVSRDQGQISLLSRLVVAGGGGGAGGGGLDTDGGDAGTASQGGDGGSLGGTGGGGGTLVAGGPNGFFGAGCIYASDGGDGELGSGGAGGIYHAGSGGGGYFGGGGGGGWAVGCGSGVGPGGGGGGSSYLAPGVSGEVVLADLSDAPVVEITASVPVAPVAPAAGPQGPAGPMGERGPQGKAGRSAGTVRCTRLVRRTPRRINLFRCRFVDSKPPRRGAKVSVQRNGRAIARGTATGQGRMVLRSSRPSLRAATLRAVGSLWTVRMR